ncbi:MAG: hypothetical protein M1355_00410 [Patescibacteria group bacterium]|nr:hypothetical protein [Patescibacteria group bacterium]
MEAAFNHHIDSILRASYRELETIVRKLGSKDVPKGKKDRLAYRKKVLETRVIPQLIAQV